MLLKSILIALAAPLLVLSKVVINSATYSGNGTVTLSITEYTDAPSNFQLALSNSTSNSTFLQTVQSGTGTYTVTLPHVAPGSYSIIATDGTGAVLSKSKPFSVGASDFGTASPAATYAFVSTGTAVPFITKSTEVVNSSTIVTSYTLYGTGQPIPTVSTSVVSPTASAVNVTSLIVTTSGTFTLTIPTVATTSVTVTPAPVLITTSASAATATATTSKSGASPLKVGGWAAALAGVAAGALLL